MAKGNMLILLGDGDGTFTAATMSPFDTDSENANIATADFNNGGILDLVTPVDSGDVSVLLGLGNGNFDGHVVILRP